MFPYPLRRPVVGCPHVPTAHGPGAQPMTTANAQSRTASDTEAMTAVPQLPPATDSQPIVAIGAFRQDAWMRRGVRLLNGGADLSPGWCPDDQALSLILDGLQTIYRLQFPVMRQYEAETYYGVNGRIVFTLSKGGLPGVSLPRATIKGDARYLCSSISGANEVAASYEVRPKRKK